MSTKHNVGDPVIFTQVFPDYGSHRENEPATVVKVDPTDQELTYMVEFSADGARIWVHEDELLGDLNAHGIVTP